MKIGQLFVQLFIVFVLLSIVTKIADNQFFRPLEPIFLSDKETLEKELDSLRSATAQNGNWGEQRIIWKSRLIVSANLKFYSDRARLIADFEEVMMKNGWIPNVAEYESAFLSFCKNRYLVGFYQLSTYEIGVSFTVKLRARDNCVPADGVAR